MVQMSGLRPPCIHVSASWTVSAPADALLPSPPSDTPAPIFSVENFIGTVLMGPSSSALVSVIELWLGTAGTKNLGAAAAPPDWVAAVAPEVAPPLAPALLRSVTEPPDDDDDDDGLELAVRWPPPELYGDPAVRGSLVTFDEHDWYVCRGGETVEAVARAFEFSPEVVAICNTLARRRCPPEPRRPGPAPRRARAVARPRRAAASPRRGSSKTLLIRVHIIKWCTLLNGVPLNGAPLNGAPLNCAPLYLRLIHI